MCSRLGMVLHDKTAVLTKKKGKHATVHSFYPTSLHTLGFTHFNKKQTIIVITTEQDEILPKI